MKKLLCLLLCLAMVLSLAACGGKTETPAAEPAAEAGSSETAAPARTDLNMIIQVEATSLDPQISSVQYDYQVMRNLNGTLMNRTVNDELVPGVAESYTVDETGTVYTFKLRQGVKFHNGEEVKADDVVYTIERAKNAVTEPTDYKIISSARAVSDYEVEITLTAPYSPFLSILETVPFSILNRKGTEELGEGFARAPIGCGPYQFVEWVSGEHITLKAFDEYYEGAPDIKDVTIKFVGDNNTALIAVESGDTDFSYVYPAASEAEIQENAALSLVRYNATALQFFTLNTQCEKLSDVRVRQAINYALNRDDVVAVAAEGLGIATSQYCNPNTFGYVEGMEGYTQDIEKAKALMAEAGYADGFSINIIAQDAPTSKMAQCLADNLKELNIECTIETQETATAVANFRSGDYEIGVLGINNAMLDFDKMKMIFDAEGSLNLCQATLDEMKPITDQFAAATLVVDDAERLELYKTLEQDIWDAAFYVPVYFPLRSVLMNSNLTIDGVRGSGVAHIYEMHWN